jgi:N-glycosidase YbiA
MTRILFYNEYDDYGWCSNFASCPILLKGRLWPTTEHYYQAQKYAGTATEELVRIQPSPMHSKQFTRDPNYPPRADWDAVKDAVMLDALRAKFSQHDHLRDWLLATGEAELVEHTANDAYWADAGDGSGRNMLGVLLMQVRAELRR